MRKVTMAVESWPTKYPFSITGHTFIEARVLLVTLEQEGAIGRGEGTGIYYLGETGDTLLKQALTLKESLEKGLTRLELQTLLPRGGARNAIDCALWDLEAKLQNKSIWQLTGINPGDIITVNTLGIETPERMAAMASKLDTPKIKIKLDGQQVIQRLNAVRSARPDAELVIDANQGWTFDKLVELAPLCKELGVSMIEQPLPRGADAELENYKPPLPLCADESCLDTSEFEQAASRYQMINIKLDKAGGLTEALKLAELAAANGLGLMVGNMLGTSLGMAPAYVVAQLSQLADLDGPVLLKDDRDSSLNFTGGVVSVPKATLWG